MQKQYSIIKSFSQKEFEECFGKINNTNDCKENMDIFETEQFINYYYELQNKSIPGIFNKKYFERQINSITKKEIINSFFIKDNSTNNIAGVYQYSFNNYYSTKIKESSININFIYLSPEYRKKGISSIIINEIMDDIKNKIYSSRDQLDTLELEMHCVSKDGQIFHDRILKMINAFLDNDVFKNVNFKDNTISFNDEFLNYNY